MHIDFEVNTRIRIEVPSSIRTKILDKIKSGEITDYSGMVNECKSSGQYIETRLIHSTTEQIHPSQNDGKSTFKVCDNNNLVLYENGETNEGNRSS